MTWGALVVSALLACGSEPGSTASAERACELLRVERDLQVPPPARGTVSRSIGRYFTDFFDAGASNAVVYVAPAHAGASGTIAEEVGDLEGVRVVEVLDQDQVYDEFKSLFEDSPQLLEAVDPAVLPATIRIDAADDDALDGVIEWASDDDRIQEVLDHRDIAAATLGLISREFDDELAELERIAAGELKRAVETLRTTKRPSLVEITDVVTAISDYIADSCAEGVTGR